MQSASSKLPAVAVSSEGLYSTRGQQWLPPYREPITPSEADSSQSSDNSIPFSRTLKAAVDRLLDEGTNTRYVGLPTVDQSSARHWPAHPASRLFGRPESSGSSSLTESEMREKSSSLSSEDARPESPLVPGRGRGAGSSWGLVDRPGRDVTSGRTGRCRHEFAMPKFGSVTACSMPQRPQKCAGNETWAEHRSEQAASSMMQLLKLHLRQDVMQRTNCLKRRLGNSIRPQPIEPTSPRWRSSSRPTEATVSSPQLDRSSMRQMSRPNPTCRQDRLVEPRPVGPRATGLRRTPCIGPRCGPAQETTSSVRQLHVRHGESPTKMDVTKSAKTTEELVASTNARPRGARVKPTGSSVLRLLKKIEDSQSSQSWRARLPSDGRIGPTSSPIKNTSFKGRGLEFQANHLPTRWEDRNLRAKWTREAERKSKIEPVREGREDEDVLSVRLRENRRETRQRGERQCKREHKRMRQKVEKDNREKMIQSRLLAEKEDDTSPISETKLKAIVRPARRSRVAMVTNCAVQASSINKPAYMYHPNAFGLPGMTDLPRISGRGSDKCLGEKLPVLMKSEGELREGTSKDGFIIAQIPQCY
ncbi:unnamed protein product [Protopolystoma xenopodis]|uniref:Uncharacterized protein n=1 Tax=Protopolystoma xenopodis TaxID=117903 RepID=A0A3S5AYB7_9PLAT|nr:unnamed protein product [Protopolystoma xenopodis]